MRTKLKQVEVQEYKSVRSSNLFGIDDVTCLVGKNESGKTTVLEAIYRLNPVVANGGRFDVTEDYPRKDVEDYRQDVESKRRTPAIVVRAVFELEPKDSVNWTLASARAWWSRMNLYYPKGTRTSSITTFRLMRRSLLRHSSERCSFRIMSMPRR